MNPTSDQGKRPHQPTGFGKKRKEPQHLMLDVPRTAGKWERGTTVSDNSSAECLLLNLRSIARVGHSGTHL